MMVVRHACGPHALPGVVSNGQREPATHTQAIHRDVGAGGAIYTTRRGEQEQRAQPPYRSSDDIDGGAYRGHIREGPSTPQGGMSKNSAPSHPTAQAMT